ncbi:hypothetical protein EP201_01515 [Campylobacter jejuni]|nr:hypothetical protein [Campylobacter jejuni]
MVKLWQFLKELGGCFSPFLNFFMVKLRIPAGVYNLSFSPFLNFFMVKLRIPAGVYNLSFSPFLNFFMVK